MISANDGIGADNLGSGDGMKEEGEIGMSSYKERQLADRILRSCELRLPRPLSSDGFIASRRFVEIRQESQMG